MEQHNKIKFEVETSQVLKILANDIYDSPLALLRENVQNAYDAILMESQKTGKDLSQFCIELSINKGVLEIIDNGIGMPLEVLRNNFWKPGSSGKKTELAAKAGVIGTFGIGALANFGVCEKLEVFTKAHGQKQIHSWVEKKDIKIGDDCISYKELKSEVPNGTKVVAYLNTGINLTPDQISSYIKQYVDLLPVKLTINGTPFTANTGGLGGLSNYLGNPSKLKLVESFRINSPSIEFNVDFHILNETTVALELYDFVVGGQTTQGFLYLIQGKTGNMGYRNRFGLANVPFSSSYSLGGVLNLACLVPTAGREAISRESIQLIQRIINLLEQKLTTKISVLDVADRIQNFINYISSKNLTNLAGNVSVNYQPNSQKVKLSKVKALVTDRKAHYYKGNHQSIMEMFSGEGSILFMLSNQGSRRNVQERYLKSIANIPEIPDNVQISDVVNKSDLSSHEFSLSFKLKRILEEDYLIPSIEIKFSTLSHGVQFLVKQESNSVVVNLHREGAAIKHLYIIYEEEYGMFDDFIKDFVRTNLYNKVQPYIPSSQRQGADALRNILSKKRELYKYSIDEIGSIENYLKDYQKGDVEFVDLIQKTKQLKNAQIQRVSANQLGDASQELPKIEEAPLPDNQEILNGNPQTNKDVIYDASPSVFRLDSNTNKKMLEVNNPIPQLNNFTLFLGLSDRLVRMDYDFFIDPHATKVIWGPHRVIYIFSHASKEVSLYYSIELITDSIATQMGSLSVLTTTIITKDRIFVPVPNELIEIFDVKEGEKKFYVTYDILGG